MGRGSDISDERPYLGQSWATLLPCDNADPVNRWVIVAKSLMAAMECSNQRRRPGNGPSVRS